MSELDEAYRIEYYRVMYKSAIDHFIFNCSNWKRILLLSEKDAYEILYTKNGKNDDTDGDEGVVTIDVGSGGLLFYQIPVRFYDEVEC